MAKHISLILAGPQTFADVIMAGRQPDKASALLRTIDSDTKNDPAFKEYIEEAGEKLDFDAKENFNEMAGFYATWILASYKPAWYMRNCSISLFLQHHKAESAHWQRYTSLWPTDILPGTKIANHFTDAGSLGCLITPENARNFMTDYKHSTTFKQLVDNYFGVFSWGLFDALDASASSRTSLIESSDIFSIIAPPRDGAIVTSEQQCFSTNSYDLTNLAIQAFSVLLQIGSAQIQRYTQSGDVAKVEAIKKEMQNTIDMLVRNATAYAKKVIARTELDLPLPSENMWK